MSGMYIKAEGLSKDYKVKTDTGGHKIIPVLENATFDIEVGEVIGIIGANGSGKSTLLKLISGVTKPNAGQVEVKGAIASLLDIGAGFHPDLSGLENIYLMGQLQGISKKVSKEFVDDIIAFSEIGEFIHLPVKNYSKGMYLRLAFSTMIHLPFDVYLMDEVLGVGDVAFQEKCKSFIRNLAISKNKILLIISHNYSELKELCTGYFTIQQQQLHRFSSLDAYFEFQSQQENTVKTEAYNLWDQGLTLKKPFDFVTLEFNHEQATYDFTQEIPMEIGITNLTEKVQMGISVRDGFNQTVFQAYFKEELNVSAQVSVKLELPKEFFNQGAFHVDLLFYANGKLHCMLNDCGGFHVTETQFAHTLALRTWGPTKPFIKIKAIKYVD